MSDSDYKTIRIELPYTLLLQLSEEALLRLKEKHGQDFNWQVLTEAGKLHPEIEKQICIILEKQIDRIYKAELAADPSNAARLKTLITTIAHTEEGEANDR